MEEVKLTDFTEEQAAALRKCKCGIIMFSEKGELCIMCLTHEEVEKEYQRILAEHGGKIPPWMCMWKPKSEIIQKQLEK